MAVVRFDVGRIGNQQVETVFFRRPVDVEPRTTGKRYVGSVIRRVLPCHCQRGRTDVAGEYGGIRAFAGQRYGHCAAACAQIPYAPLRRQVSQGRFHQMLGFGAGNQGGGRGAETAAVKLAPAEDVGHGFAVQAALLHGLQIGGLPFVQHFAVAGNQLGPRPAGNGLQKHAGFGFGQRGVLQEGFGLHGAIFRRDVFRRPFIVNPTKTASYRYSRTGGYGND